MRGPSSARLGMTDSACLDWLVIFALPMSTRVVEDPVAKNFKVTPEDPSTSLRPVQDDRDL